MGRKKGGLIEDLAKLPWQVGVVFGVGGGFPILTLLPKEMRFGLVCRITHH